MPRPRRYERRGEALLYSRLSSKPSPRAFSIGDDVIVTYPESKYFKKTGEVTDLNYLERSARKGFGDYTVTVKFPDGATRKFLMGRVRAVGFAPDTELEPWFQERSKSYAKTREMAKLRGRLGDSYYESPEYLKLLKERGG